MPPFAAAEGKLVASGVSIPFKLAPLPELRNGSDQAKDTRRQIYVVPASVAGETFELILDTGSADLWVDTSILLSGVLSAPELQDTELPIQLNYGLNGSDTTARGTAQLANVGMGSLTVHSQAFVNVLGAPAVTQYGDQGILGLGPPGQWSVVRNALSSSQWNEKTFLYNMFKQHTSLGNFFAIGFGTRDHAGVVQGGNLSIGEVPSTRAEIVDMPKLPLATGRVWDVSSGGFLVNGAAPNVSAATNSAVVNYGMMLDTGAFGAYIPPEYLAAIYSPVQGSSLLDDGAWSVPCDTRMNVSVMFGDVVYPIHPLDMTEVYDVQEGTVLCRSLFQPNTDPRIPFLIGLNVLRNTYMLFNYGDVDDPANTAPYIQILSITDAEEASREFDAMNTARIEAFMIIRRISSSFFPRPDRPWSEDATSTAPQIGRKRRLSTDEQEERETTPSAKKQRAELEEQAESKRDQSPSQPGKETEEVKEVTEGVREVELEDGKVASTSHAVDGEAPAEGSTEEAAAVPLPDSPELKATVTPEKVADEGASKAEGSAAAEEDASPEAAETTVTEDILAAALEDDVPGLTLPAHTDEEVPSTKAASSIPASHTPADAALETTQEAIAA
ncbi:acid protease [Trametes versicolor FP-101664 SS1]|uniref:acid protease n=1 Tax=Trametes versicolor (strain FP-101664) TaxID=717944 RepID=UPI0004623436|nr:acid protease [Trametes versicolor FP-101664 SS1]EIW53369.1 acid protease [Trametes versicolor FP-101664 SS1]